MVNKVPREHDEVVSEIQTDGRSFVGANIDEAQAHPRVPAHELAPPARPHWPQSDRQAVAVISCKALRRKCMVLEVFVR